MRRIRTVQELRTSAPCVATTNPNHLTVFTLGAWDNESRPDNGCNVLTGCSVKNDFNHRHRIGNSVPGTALLHACSMPSSQRCLFFFETLEQISP
jgi:hypothetical protein